MDYLVIGTGLTGAVIARKLSDQGHKVTIWESSVILAAICMTIKMNKA